MKQPHPSTTSGVFLGFFVLALVAVPSEAGAQQAWDKKIDNPRVRFRVLSEFNNEAVLDRETGLVWQQSPDTITRTWAQAVSACADLAVAGRKGWHLPLVEQLASLVDTDNIDPALPTGHPFSNVQNSVYWTATTNHVAQQDAKTLFFTDGLVDQGNKAFNSTYFWCVRGGQSFDGNTHVSLH